MAKKITQQDVVTFLQERVQSLTLELKKAQDALAVFQTETEQQAPRRGRKPKDPNAQPKAAVKRTRTVKPGGKKRGRKPKIQIAAGETAVTNETK